MFLRVDGRPWHTDYAMTHILMDKGRHVLEAYATDQAGNISEVTSIRVEIDRTGEEVTR